MLFQKKYKKPIQIFWMIVSAIVIAGMILLYIPALIF